MEGVGQQLLPPPGWVNSTTPGSATTECGAYIQSEIVTVTGDVAEPIPFATPLSWTQGSAWTTDETGIVFTCNVPGLYTIVVNQTLTLNNLAEIGDPTVYIALSVNDGLNAEINQVYTNTILVPITSSPVAVSVGFTNIINANVGTTMSVAIDSPSGNISMTSGSVGNFYQALTYNLIAQGVYGNTVPI
jgi:hypothetical protein